MNKTQSFFAIFSLLFLLLFSLLSAQEAEYANEYSDPINSDSENNTSILYLNGIWDFTPEGLDKMSIQVPCFYVWQKIVPNTNGSVSFGDDENGPWKIIEDHPETLYKRNFNIPQEMAGKRIFLHFEAVNYLAYVYINQELVGYHVGGLVPFELDITPYVNWSSSNQLEVAIKYWDARFIELWGTKSPYWPFGFYRNYWFLGIVNDVYLVARSPVYVDDVFVRTSVRNKKIFTTITVNNVDSLAHTVNVASHIESPSIVIGEQQIEVPGGGSVTVDFEKQWQDPVLWSPRNPHLYNCVTNVYENQNLIHGKTTHFGFREFWIEGTNFFLNGIRWNLRGDNLTIQSEGEYWNYLVNDHANWSTSLDSMLAMHINVVRFHEEPPPQWMIDLCDEKGMLVVAESHILSNYKLVFSYPENYLNNCRMWLKDWVKTNRNHPSIVVWSAENEMVYNNVFTAEQIATFGDAIKEVDQTRPIMYEGDEDVSFHADIKSIHYPWGYYSAWPEGRSIYQLAEYVSSYKPTSFGEFNWKKSNLSETDRVRLQCLKTRAGRYVGFDDVRPFRLDWAWHPDPGYSSSTYSGWQPTAAEIQFLSNTMNPVAVFDKHYYEYATYPSIPEFDEGVQLTRDLIIFNDEEENTQVEVQWRILVDEESVDSGNFLVNVNLGTFQEKQITFNAPYVSQNKIFDLELSSWKNGVRKFSERYQFKTRNTGMAPPKKVTDVDIQRNGNSLQFSWSPVTQNLDNTPVTISRYDVYRATDLVSLSYASSKLSETTSTSFTDNSSGITENPELNYLYGVKAIDSDNNESELSNVVGEFDFDLVTTGTTSYNQIALPFILQGVNNAQDLKDFVGTRCNSVAEWNPNTQSYDQYQEPLNNFTVEGGKPYYVHVTQEGVFTLVGALADPQFDLLTSSKTDINEIMLPLGKLSITKASELADEIPNCTSVGKWDPQTQGFQQYAPSVPPTDFSVRVGYPYYVNVSQNSQWPESTQRDMAVNRTQNSKEAVSHVPHLVWGELPSELKEAPKERIRFEAFLIGNENERLTEQSPGSLIEDGYWAVQCASLNSGWKAGDQFKIVFRDSETDQTLEAEIELTWNPTDKIEDCYSCVSETTLPAIYYLTQNYPNPFNAETKIEFGIAENSRITLKIYDTLGREVETLVNETRPAGHYQVQWKAENISSGVYFYHLRTENEHQNYSKIEKCIYMK